jgi:hypothetical protein
MGEDMFVFDGGTLDRGVGRLQFLFASKRQIKIGRKASLFREGKKAHASFPVYLFV